MHAQGDLARLGEFDGIAGQIEQYLPQPARIHLNEVRNRRIDVGRHLQALWVSLNADQPHDIFDQVAQIDAGTSNSSFPASIFEKSRISLMTVNSAWRYGGRFPHSRAAIVQASVSSSRSVMPITPFMGVRISWLMLARNSLFA